MPPLGFEPTISAGERPQTYALDRAATGTGISSYSELFYLCCIWWLSVSRAVQCLMRLRLLSDELDRM